MVNSDIDNRSFDTYATGQKNTDPGRPALRSIPVDTVAFHILDYNRRKNSCIAHWIDTKLGRWLRTLLVNRCYEPTYLDEFVSRTYLPGILERREAGDERLREPQGIDTVSLERTPINEVLTITNLYHAWIDKSTRHENEDWTHLQLFIGWNDGSTT